MIFGLGLIALEDAGDGWRSITHLSRFVSDFLEPAHLEHERLADAPPAIR